MRYLSTVSFVCIFWNKPIGCILSIQRYSQSISPFKDNPNRYINKNMWICTNMLKYAYLHILCESISRWISINRLLKVLFIPRLSIWFKYVLSYGYPFQFFVSTTNRLSSTQFQLCTPVWYCRLPSIAACHILALGVTCFRNFTEGFLSRVAYWESIMRAFSLYRVPVRTKWTECLQSKIRFSGWLKRFKSYGWRVYKQNVRFIISTRQAGNTTGINLSFEKFITGQIKLKKTNSPAFVLYCFPELIKRFTNLKPETLYIYVSVFNFMIRYV